MVIIMLSGVVVIGLNTIDMIRFSSVVVIGLSTIDMIRFSSVVVIGLSTIDMIRFSGVVGIRLSGVVGIGFSDIVVIRLSTWLVFRFSQLTKTKTNQRPTFGLGPVQLQFFYSPRTGLLNTIYSGHSTNLCTVLVQGTRFCNGLYSAVTALSQRHTNGDLSVLLWGL